MGALSTFKIWFSNKSVWSPDWLAAAGIDPRSSTEHVTAANAQSITAINRSVSLLSEALAGSKIQLIQSLPTGGKQVYNPGRLALWQYTDIEAGLVDALISGNGYWYRDTLKCIPAWRVSLEVFDDGLIQYLLQADASLNLPEERLKPDEILHLKFRTGNSKHNLLGVSPIASARPALDSILQQKTAHSTIYRNISMPLLTLTTDKALGKEAAKRLRDAWTEGTSKQNLGKVPVLDNGLTVKQLDIPSALDFQLSEMSTLSVLEVSRLYGVPAQLLSEAQDVSFGSAVELQRSFVAHGLRPWAARFSDMLSHSLIGEKRLRAGFRLEIDLSDALLGHGKERAEYLSLLTNGGVISVNESRNMIGLPDIENGDILRSPVNNMPLNHWINYNPGSTAEQPAPSPTDPNKQLIIGSKDHEDR